MKTLLRSRELVAKDDLCPAVPRHPSCLFVTVTLALSLTRIATAQTNPSSDAILSFPEQSKPPSEVAVPSHTATDSPAPSVVPATNQPPKPSGSPAALPTTDVPIRPARDGFYFRFGSGSSLLRLKGTGPNGVASIAGLGSGVNVALGGAIARGLVLSGAIHAINTTGEFKGGPYQNAQLTLGGETLDASSRATVSFAEIAALFDYYPSVTQGWHVGAGIGLASSSIVNSADDSVYFATGFGALIQGGYEWHLGKDWCLGINLVASGATKGNFKESENQEATDYSLRALSIGVQSALVYF